MVYSYDGERFYDAIEISKSGKGYWTGERRELNPSEFINNKSIDDLLRGFIQISPQQKEELETLIKKFLDENCSTGYWEAINTNYHPGNNI